MSEPAEIASSTDPVAEGIWHWHVHNAAIGGGISSSHAIRVTLDDGSVGCVLVDPVRLDPHALQQLPGRPVAVVLTAHGHQRSAWRIRREHEAEVWAPAGSPGLEEAPDHEYGDGDRLPGGLRAIHTPGPEQEHFGLVLDSPRALFVPDLVRRADDGTLEFVPFEYHADPDATIDSVRRLAELQADLLLFSHGTPITTDGARELLRLAESAAAAH